ncbi:MAG: hypothetical protein ABI311_05850 [Gemmatimonadaceae bacterium]
MRVPRFSSFGTLLLVSMLLPVSSQGQFGRLIHAAKSAKTSIDSAKAVIDTTKTVVSSGKAAVADATNGSLTVESATDTSKGKQGGGAKGAAGKASGSGPSASAAVTEATGTAGAANKRGITASGSKAGTRARGTPADVAQTASAQASITEPTYAQFARGAAVQRALLKANPNDQAGALAAALSASGLNKTDYAVLRSRVAAYYAFAQSNTLANATGVISAPELTVLNAHKTDVLQLMQP